MTACEGDVGSRLEANCDWIANRIGATVPYNEISKELANIQAGNPPDWYLQPALDCSP
jgi:hypothetical protein